jgi:hypothetical protein
MTELETVEEGNEVGRKSGRKLGRKGRRKWRHYRAALKLSSPVLPIVAVVVAALTYIVLGKPPDGTIEVARWSIIRAFSPRLPAYSFPWPSGQ